jgi:hypothetical protein
VHHPWRRHPSTSAPGAMEEQEEEEMALFGAVCSELIQASHE